jgi:hypothetical protein
MGYSKDPGGMTSGSAETFSKKGETGTKTVHVHRPHPGDIMKRKSVLSVHNQLVKNGDIKV